MTKFYKKGSTIPVEIGRANKRSEQELFIFGVDCTVAGKTVTALKHSRARIFVLSNPKFRRGYRRFTAPSGTFKNINVNGPRAYAGIEFPGSLVKKKEALSYKYAECLND